MTIAVVLWPLVLFGVSLHIKWRRCPTWPP